MIRDLTRNNQTNWQEKIRIELELSDLQILYDAIGILPPKYLKIKHKNTSFNKNDLYYYSRHINDLYEDLHVIISEHNGVDDDNKMVNTNVEVEVKGIDEEDE